MAQQVLNSQTEFENWFQKNEDQLPFRRWNGSLEEQPTSFPCVVVWNTDYERNSFVDYVYPFAEINNEERHTLKRLHSLARFGGGDKIEYIEFCDGEEYQKYLADATHIALRLVGIK